MISKERADEMFLEAFGPFSDHEAEYETFTEWLSIFEPETEEEISTFFDELKKLMKEEEDSKDTEEKRLKEAIKHALSVLQPKE